MDAITQRLAALKHEISELKGAISRQKTQLQNGGLSSCGAALRPAGPALRRRKVLEGHFNKVYCLDWAGDGEHLITGSQDGKLIVWDGKTRLREAMISLPRAATWAMTVKYLTGSNRFIACGGLDNCCSIFDVEGVGASSGKPSVVLPGHDGYVSGCEWLDSDRLVTTSGDSTCRLWDVRTRTAVQTFLDHTSDVMCVSCKPGDSAVFVTGSVDATARVWDARTGARAVQTFVGHEGDINVCKFQGNGLVFGTGGEDSRIKLFDLRSYARVNELMNEAMVCSVTALAFSRSGRIAFGGYDDCNVCGWDCLSENPPMPLYSLSNGHSHRVSCAAVNVSGQALATGSWDNSVFVWA